ncbi:hypothetical protein CKSOR_00559 [Candidatus Kinetoplastibacterium sorsogonicusi]|uniref:Transmembrane protein n=1 Tax=Candidatus Kinetoplastidibacterium kentomonadis TaxID=1576550 RepID=A0A3Q8F3X0_9PROT|nr:hypothetical protein [Candidatus Kinetoplastibacterium sorsogonicusi]AWD32665.1 hypothetical protein CKSOR_00559 [Candidatus Kinetoplastibacterium sorsogonicusi]
MNGHKNIIDFKYKDHIFLFILYLLFSSGFATMGTLSILTLASVMVIYLKRNCFNDNFYILHFDWLLRTFWISLPFYLFSFIFMKFYIGYLLITVTTLWTTYRIVKGWLSLIYNDEYILE